MPRGAAQLSERSHLKALLELSKFRRGVTAIELESMTRTSPDPATAIQAVATNLLSASPALVDKWRKTLTALWAHHHPEVPALPPLPITKKEATGTFLLLDALSMLDALNQKPARVVTHHGETLLASREVGRLAHVLDSLDAETMPRARTEADLPQLRRLREVLAAARLLKVYRGELQVVASRLKTFLSLPRSYQWFVLWHADVYHVCWGEFARDWHDELRVIQDYLPLLWEISDDAETNEVVDKHNWCMNVIEAFAPLWGEQGLLRTHVRLPQLTFFHESALPAAINQIIINDLLARYGLIQFEPDGNFIWTPLGSTLLEAERNQELPCGLELLG